MKCIECKEDTVKIYYDIRTPPLDDNPCLCPACFEVALDEEIGATETRLENLIETKANLPGE